MALTHAPLPLWAPRRSDICVYTYVMSGIAIGAAILLMISAVRGRSVSLCDGAQLPPWRATSTASTVSGRHRQGGCNGHAPAPPTRESLIPWKCGAALSRLTRPQIFTCACWLYFDFVLDFIISVLAAILWFVVAAVITDYNNNQVRPPSDLHYRLQQCSGEGPA